LPLKQQPATFCAS